MVSLSLTWEVVWRCRGLKELEIGIQRKMGNGEQEQMLNRKDQQHVFNENNYVLQTLSTTYKNHRVARY